MCTPSREFASTFAAVLPSRLSTRGPRFLARTRRSPPRFSTSHSCSCARYGWTAAASGTDCGMGSCAISRLVDNSPNSGIEMGWRSLNFFSPGAYLAACCRSPAETLFRLPITASRLVAALGEERKRPWRMRVRTTFVEPQRIGPGRGGHTRPALSSRLCTELPYKASLAYTSEG